MLIPALKRASRNIRLGYHRGLLGKHGHCHIVRASSCRGSHHNACLMTGNLQRRKTGSKCYPGSFLPPQEQPPAHALEPEGGYQSQTSLTSKRHIYIYAQCEAGSVHCFPHTLHLSVTSQHWPETGSELRTPRLGQSSMERQAESGSHRHGSQWHARGRGGGADSSSFKHQKVNRN